MQLFYQNIIEGSPIVLDKDVAHHLVHVLRMKVGSKLQLTSGQSDLYTVEIIQADKKSVAAQIISKEDVIPEYNLPSIAIAFTKNIARMEWFLEKACEIGVKEIFPLLTKRTERTHFKMDRFRNILAAAMCQSKRTQLPILHDPISFQDCLNINSDRQILMAHCMDEGNKQHIMLSDQIQKTSLILIGPEGDFTEDEVALCMSQNAIAIDLGSARLRTETAGIVALVLLNNI